MKTRSHGSFWKAITCNLFCRLGVKLKEDVEGWANSKFTLEKKLKEKEDYKHLRRMSIMLQKIFRKNTDNEGGRGMANLSSPISRASSRETQTGCS